MSRQRSLPTSPTALSVHERSIRVLAAGTLFLTHTLDLHSHPAPASSVRAHGYARSRNGSAASVLTVLAQFRRAGVEGCWLIASLGGNDEGIELIRELEREGISTRYCRVWDGHGIPAAWVLHAADSDTQTVINHNPLPDISHDEFIAHLGPLLAPENYPPAPPPPDPSSPSLPSPRPSFSSAAPTPRGPAPFDWLHFEGRSVKTTLSNLVGLDGLARERRWRAQCVFSVDIGRRARQGIEALIPHADVLFLNKHYAQTHSPAYARTPRAFLLAVSALAPPHALLVAYWGADGAAVLSVPTREYFQSSGWLEPPAPPPQQQQQHAHDEVQSVRSGSDFWAGAGRRGSPASSAFFSAAAASPKGKGKARADSDHSDDDADSQGTEVGARASAQPPAPRAVVDEAGAQDAFVAGMMYALSRRLLPGAPYAPGLEGRAPALARGDGARWRLDECLRFATELAGRKARKRGWDGLGDEMARAGWFNS